MRFAEVASQLAEIARQCCVRGWALATSGNFSAVLDRSPLRLAITPTGADKAGLTSEDILEIDDRGTVLRGSGRPSAETSLHLAIVRSRGAGAVLHTHSVWSTILSEEATGGGLAIEGYEMLKGLDGVATHQHREWLPMLENRQDWANAVPELEAMLTQNPSAHGFLIRRHGLYTWGQDVAEAKHQLEALEFLLEVIGRKRGVKWQP